jgi:hypothetical protein
MALFKGKGGRMRRLKSLKASPFDCLKKFDAARFESLTLRDLIV